MNTYKNGVKDLTKNKRAAPNASLEAFKAAYINL